MRFKREYRPELVASKDETRRHLTGVYIDREGRMVATDGHHIIAVPCEVEPGDVPGVVPVEAVTGARKVRRYSDKDKRAKLRIRKTLADDGKALHRRPSDVTFPEWRKVFPDWKPGDKGTITFGVQPRYLVNVLEAMGGEGIVSITLRISKYMLDPIIVSRDWAEEGVQALVMPGRVDHGGSNL